MKHMIAMLALLAHGCAAPAPAEPTGPSKEWCANKFCAVEATTYTAVGEGIYAILAPVLERYRVATGRADLSADPQAGIPVMWAEHLLVDDPARPGEYLRDGAGKEIEACAQTENDGVVGVWQRTQAVRVDPTPPLGCPEPAVSLAHEIIHALAPMAKHVDVDSLFAPSTGVRWRPIDSAALERLCEGFDCYEFNPEQ